MRTNIENLNENYYLKTVLVLMYNNNNTALANEMVQLCRKSPYITRVVVLDEYSDDSDIYELANKAEIFRNHNTLDRKAKLEEIVYNYCGNCDWILFLDLWQSFNEEEFLNMIEHLTLSEAEGFRICKAMTYQSDFRAVRTYKFDGFYDDLMPKLKDTLVQDHTENYIINYATNEEVLYKEYKDYLYYLDLFRLEPQFAHPEYWLNAVKMFDKVQDTSFLGFVKTKNEFLDKAYALTTYIDKEKLNPTVVSQIYLEKGSECNNVFDRNEWEHKAETYDFPLPSTLARMYKNKTECIHILDKIRRSSLEYFEIEKFILALKELKKNPYDQRYQYEDFNLLWYEIIPKLLSELYWKNKPLAIKLYETAIECPHFGAFDEYINNNSQYFF